MLSKQGPTGVFTGAMATPITRFCDLEIVSATVVFTILEFKFPSTETQEVDAATVTWPNSMRFKLRQVSRFQVSSGSVLAHFHYPKTT
jgi:hypothetical protein